jgi:hypothetical protein
MEEKSIKQMSLSEIEDEIKIYEKASTVEDKIRLETLQLAKKKRLKVTVSP